LIPSITIRAAIIAFVVAIAGIILPAIAEIKHSLVNSLLYIKSQTNLSHNVVHLAMNEVQTHNFIAQIVVNPTTMRS
jgi:uncharacterized protein YqgC (DUF456 family)